MAVIAFILVNGILIAIMTGVLAVALLITGKEINSDSLSKSAAVVTFSTIVSFIPYVGGVFAMVCWFAGVMGFFERNFIEALLVTLACGMIFFVASIGLAVLGGILAGAAGVAAG